ncbi:unnamed protein product [Pelagomonas calceolata]|uniref:Uncharacterized protein n=2 Tax=Pelagomonas calceolata TaxID=35677 RepID=A0A8J2S866_9STRA|nr:unnamed protein product [Pelagomonas calceolata]
MQGEQYYAEGSQPVATGTVVEQPVVLSGTIVNVEQPAPTAYAVQQPAKMPVVIAGAPPPTMVVTTATTVVQPAAPAPAGRWLGGNACGCCDPPGGGPLCCTAFCCPCVVVGQLWHRIVERGGGGTVLGILCGVSIAAYVLEIIVDAILAPMRVGWIFRFPAGFVYLYYMLKIREAAAREGGFQDHPVLCGNECCETYWCLPCIACFIMRHDIAAKQPGYNYQGCGNMAGTVHDLPA